MTASDVYIAVGSNIDPEEKIPVAARLLALSVDLVAVSTLFWAGPPPRPRPPPVITGVLQFCAPLRPRPP